MRHFVALFMLAVSVPSQAEGPLRILLTNDDGFDSPGIQAMRDALIEARHDVTVIAPATQQSGASAAVSARGVRVSEHPDKHWAVHGRPADAVRVGLGYIMHDNPPDLVIAGANFGHNTGKDVNISGTVGAALTAHSLGVPAIAISVEMKLSEAEEGFSSTVAAFPGAGRLLVRLIDNLELEDLTAVLNINYPAVLPLDVKGVRWTPLSEHSLLGKRYNKRPDGTYTPELRSPDPHSRKFDAESLADGWVTMTFLDGDMSVRVHRSQKYLDRGLLDRNYEPANRPAPGPRPQAQKIQAQPIIPTPKPLPLREDPKDDQIIEFESAPPAQNTQTVPVNQPSQVENSQPTTGEDLAPQPSHSDSPLTSDPPAIEASESETVAEPEAESEAREASPAAAEQPQKRKPDSWLRRMFDPKSWRR